jgi:hypothetical protein
MSHLQERTDEEQIEHLIRQRQIVKRIMELMKQIREERQSRTHQRSHPIDTLLETHQFYVYRTDNNQVLARGINGFEAAKDKANQLRKSMNLKWDQVKFKADRSNNNAGRYQSNLINPAGGRRTEYSARYNPSKRMRFRGYTDSQGNYHDID